MAKKKLFDRDEHARVAGAVLAAATVAETVLLGVAEHYGPLDNLLDLAIQARKGIDRLRSELHRRYVLQGLHEPLNQSPYYPTQKVRDAGEGVALRDGGKPPGAAAADQADQPSAQEGALPAAGQQGGGASPGV